MEKNCAHSESKPWIKNDGTSLSVEELKIFTKFWDKATWDRYLRSLEFVENPEFVGTISISQIDDSAHTSLAEHLPTYSELDDEMLEKLSSILSHNLLDEREKKILEMKFWENKSEREISEFFCISRGVTRKIKLRALKKARIILNEKTNLNAVHGSPGGSPLSVSI